jgi:argininosuccinate synthase
MKRVVLAYSGSAKSSAALSWLRERHQAEVVTVTVDLGGAPVVEDIRDHALRAGAMRAYVVNRRDAFARDVVLPSLKAGALADPLVTELARPLVARALVEIVRAEGVAAVAYGGQAVTASLPLQSALHALEPELQVLVPAREWASHGHEVAEDSCTVASNLWGRSIVFGSGADPSMLWQSVLASRSTRRPARPARVGISFEQGTPVAINDVSMPFGDLIDSLTAIAGAHGVGRIERSSRTVVEAPAAVVLQAAHASLQERVTPPELQRLAQLVGRQYAGILHDGLWFTPVREALDAFVNKVQEGVTGVVRLELLNGRCEVLAPGVLASTAPAEASHVTGRSLAAQ